MNVKVYNILKKTSNAVKSVKHNLKSISCRNKSCEEELNIKILEETWHNPRVSCILDEKRKFSCSNIDLSIIIPLYNSAPFIDKCLTAFINQRTEYKFEIILVNDGSRDNTEEIIDKYIKKYPEIIVKINQKNQGISAARNNGLAKVKGRYIAFADHDDWVSEDYIQRLLTIAYEKNADIVKCGYTKMINGKIALPECDADKIYMNGLGNDVLNVPGFIWGGVYKNELFERIKFPEKYWYEDMVTRFLVFRKSKIFVNISDAIYYKLVHKNNASKKVWSSENAKCLEDIYLVESLIDDNKKENLSFDSNLYKCTLDEFGRLLVFRTTGLNNQVRKQVFLKANAILTFLYKKEYDKFLNNEEKKWNNIILNKKYELWKIMGE